MTRNAPHPLKTHTLALLAAGAMATAPLVAQEATFDIFEFAVEGATLLPALAVEQAVYPHMGERKRLDDVEKAREALEKAYHAVGYLTVLVTIPQQKVDGGLVRLQVTEAPVDRLRVVGAQHYSPQAIKNGVPELAEGRVPNFQDMQAEMTELNRQGDRRVSPVLRPGRTPGTVEVDLKVQDQKPYHGNVDVNDRYSQDTSRLRASTNFRWDNLWGRQHSVGVTLQTAPSEPRESKVLSLNYTIPLKGGDMLALYGVKSDSDVSAVGDLNVIGRGTMLGLRYIKPLRGREGFFHTATWGVDYKDFNQSVNLIGSGGFNTPITYMPFVAGWDGSWQTDTHTTRVGVSTQFHVQQGLVGSEQEFADKRFKGRPSYIYFKGTLQHERSLPEGHSLHLRAQWQLAGQPLVSNEQMAIGGADTVRGYLESAAAGERGLALSAEWRSPQLSRLWPGTPDSLTELRALAFVDWGAVKVIEPITAQDRFSLASLGLGLRLRMVQGTQATVQWAYPLKAVGNTTKGDHRLHFNLTHEW